MTTPTSKQKGTPFNKGASLPPSSSSTATQHPSSGSLLAIIQSEHQSIVTNIPIVGFVASFFINRSIRKDYIDAIKGQFFEGAIKNKISLKDTSSIFNTHFLPFLSECNLEDLLLLEPILADPAGVDLVLQNLTPEPKPYLRNAFATLPIVNRLIGRLRPVDLRNYLKVWIQDAKALSNENFRTLVGGFTAHLAYAESLQSSRPHIFDQDSPEAIKLKAGFSNLLQQSEIAVQAQKLAPFSSVIRDMTIIDNRQILMASIASLYLGDTFKGDSLVPELVPRSVGTRDAPPFSLFNQIGTPLSLPEGPSWTILENFKLFTEIYITDPLSMETRRIRVPLPIPGRTTLGEVNKQLEILKRVINDPDQFDDACAQLGLVEVKEALREPFIEFSEQWGEALGQALGDFNSTATRPKESTARAQPENAASIAHPNSKGYAVESAKMHNLFLLQDGTLSLIPSGPGEKHRGIGSLSQD